MSDSVINRINLNISTLTKAATQQALLAGAVAEQLRALFVVSTALIGILKSNFDIDLARARALKALSDPIKDAQATEYVKAMLGHTSLNDQPPSEETIQNQLQEVARTRFQVIEGGKQPIENADS